MESNANTSKNISKGGKMNETTSQKQVIVARCISEADMLNIINEKLDYLIMLMSDNKKE
jgi:hypothetical protein